MRAFRYQAAPSRVVFGAGSSRRELESEVDGQGKRVLLITTKRAEELAARLAEPLGERVVGRFTDVQEHVPQGIADAARSAALETRADCLVSIGGGSVGGPPTAGARGACFPLVAVAGPHPRAGEGPHPGCPPGGRPPQPPPPRAPA